MECGGSDGPRRYVFGWSWTIEINKYYLRLVVTLVSRILTFHYGPPVGCVNCPVSGSRAVHCIGSLTIDSIVVSPNT